MGAGLYDLNGISSAVSVALIELYVAPAMMHSLKALILEKPSIRYMTIATETLHQKIKHLPQYTATEAVYMYLLLGKIPFEGQQHFRYH